MSIERGQAVFLVVGGVLIGSSVTALALKQHYQKIADAEIASVKSTYKEREQALKEREVQLKKQNLDLLDIVVDTAEKLDNNTPVPPISYTPEEIEESEELSNGLGYTHTEGDEVTDIQEPLNVVKEHRPPAETIVSAGLPVMEAPVVRKPGEGEPYIISVDQFMANEEDYDQITLTYYSDDQQLADDHDSLVNDVDRSVGNANLNHFGQGSGNSDIVYVRNEHREVDFEIIRDDRSFAHDILGMDEDEIQPPKSAKVKKFRADH